MTNFKIPRSPNYYFNKTYLIAPVITENIESNPVASRCGTPVKKPERKRCGSRLSRFSYGKTESPAVRKVFMKCKKLYWQQLCRLELDAYKCEESVRGILDEFKDAAHKCSEILCKSNTTDYIISGLKKTESDRIIPIIESAICSSNIYVNKKKIKKMIEYHKRVQLRTNMICQDSIYVVGGVVNTPFGPVYCIGGVYGKKDPIDTSNLKKELNFSPKVPASHKNVKFVLGGVVESRCGSVYTINSTVPYTPCPACSKAACECFKAVANFWEQHSKCMLTYDNFLATLNEEFDGYLGELNNLRKTENDDQATESVERQVHNICY